MAKRSRGAVRPGQTRPAARRPQQRPQGRTASAAATETIASTSPAVPAADLVEGDDELVEARPAPRGKPTKESARAAAMQPSGLLAARAAQEYAYVARDVRHIAVVGGGLLIVLLVLYVLVEVLGIIKI